MWHKKYLSWQRVSEISRTLVNISKKILGNPVFGCFFLGLSIVYSIALLFYGIDFTDTFFHLNIMEAVKLPPLIGLTTFIGKFWMGFFGDYLLSFRVLNLLLFNLALIFPFVFLIPKGQRGKNIILLGITIVLASTLNTNVFGYDRVTLILLSISSVLAIKYYQKGKKSYLFAYGLFSALLILARFPNIVILPLSIILLALIEYQKENNDKKRFFIEYSKVILFYLLIFTGFFLLILFFLYGNVDEFFLRVVNSISGLGKGYAPKRLVWRYLFHSVKIFQYIAVIVLLNLFVNRTREFSIKLRSLFIFLSFFVFLLFLRLEIGIRSYNWDLSLFYSTICYLLMICIVSYYFKKHSYEYFIIIFMLAGFSIIPAMGSNTGLLKTTLFLLCYFPFLFIYFMKIKIVNKKYNIVLLSILILFSIYTRVQNVYEDSAITKLNCKLKIRSLRGIHTTKARCDFIEDVLTVVNTEKTKNRSVQFYGKTSHIFYFLSKIAPLFNISFSMLTDNANEIAGIAEVFKRIRPVFILITDYPNENDGNRKSLFEDLMLSNNYIISVKNGFKVFYPN